MLTFSTFVLPMISRTETIMLVRRQIIYGTHAKIYWRKKFIFYWSLIVICCTVHERNFLTSRKERRKNIETLWANKPSAFSFCNKLMLHESFSGFSFWNDLPCTKSWQTFEQVAFNCGDETQQIHVARLKMQDLSARKVFRMILDVSAVVCEFFFCFFDWSKCRIAKFERTICNIHGLRMKRIKTFDSRYTQIKILASSFQ